MYARLYAMTDDTRYPCPSLAIPQPPFMPYQEPVFYTRPVEPQEEDYSPPQPSKQMLPTSSSLHLSSSSSSTPIPTPSPSLLPVLDCRFNLREICKQSILLEDHLSHKEKRCTDCCVKHFLALEGLCEEAVTLDKDGTHQTTISELPQKIRELQKKWYEDPEKNAHYCSQELRKLRKQFQIDVFPIAFHQNQGCGGGTNSCSIQSST